VGSEMCIRDRIQPSRTAAVISVDDERKRARVKE